MPDQQYDFKYQWQRVSLISIIYFFVSRGLKIVKELAMNAAPAFVGLLVAVDDKAYWFSIAAIGFIALIIIDIVALYLTFRYRVEDEQIIVRQGVFKKEILNLKYVRVQNINNAVPWYFKPFNLVRCSLDSAGSAAKEVSIPGITIERSDAISEIIHNYQKSHRDIKTEDLKDESNEYDCLKLTNWESTKFGFTNSMIFVFAGVLFPVFDRLTDSYGATFKDFFLQASKLLPFPEIVSNVILVIIGVLLSGFLLLCITALGAFIRFYNFELYDEGKKLKRIAGLLERQTIFLNKNKVQGVTIKQNVFARLLGMVTIYFQQTQGEGKSAAKKQAFIIPTLKSGKWQKQLKIIYPELVNIKLNFIPIDPRYIYKVTLYGYLLPVSLIAIPLFLYTTFHALFLYLLAIPFVVIAFLRYRRYGYCVTENYLIIRDGIIGTNYHILHRFKAQHLTESTSPSQRRLNLGSLKVKMAYSSLSLPYIQLSELRKIINQTLLLTESSNKSWM